jgi:hypothetical protein
MRFLMSAGIEGFVLGATNNTLYVPANFGKAYVGYDVSIVSGTGAGQRRTILDVSDAIVEDIAIATTVTNTLGDITLTDTAKNWGVNRWLGYPHCMQRTSLLQSLQYSLPLLPLLQAFRQ